MVEKDTKENKTESTTSKKRKTESHLGVKCDPTFCSGPIIKKTNSVTTYGIIQEEGDFFDKE